MKTKITNPGNLMMISLIVIVCGMMTSCSSNKLFTGKMKYTYYKKVKAHSINDSVTETASVNAESLKENKTQSRTTSSDSTNSVSASTVRENRVTSEKNVLTTFVNKVSQNEKTACAPENKSVQKKASIKERVLRRFVDPSNLKSNNSLNGKWFWIIFFIVLGAIIIWALLIWGFVILLGSGPLLYSGD